MPSFPVASRFPCRFAIVQSVAVTVAKANSGKSGFRFPGMLSSASARHVQVHPLGGLDGFATDLSAPLMAPTSISVSGIKKQGAR
jgi:hypothetical protein